MIVHTDNDGLRGVDFKLKPPVHVVVAKHLTTQDEAEQGLGRGARHLGNRAEGTLVVAAGTEQAKIKPEKIVSALINRDYAQSF